MAYSPRNELAFRLGMAVTLSATLVCATPAFAAEAQTASSTAQQTQASAAAATEAAQDASASSTTPAATTTSTEKAASNESEITAETKQTEAATAVSPDSSAAEDQAATSADTAASSSSTESSNADSSSSSAESAASEGQSTSTAETSEKSADSNDSTGSNSASAAEISTPATSAESDSAATASDATNTTAAASAKVQALSANVETEEKTELDGIDISGYQKGIDIAAVPSDFVIVKVSEGTTGTATFKEQADAALKAGKLLGLYHFANADTTASAQAEFFADSVKDYLGKALLFLDWEDTSYSKVRAKGTSWAAEWLERVYKLTGVKPLIYMNKNATREYDFSDIAKEYKLWAAQYADMDTHDGYQDDPWQDTKGYGAWGSAPTILQYSSTTHLDGYDGNVDVDKFYGSASDWQKLAAVTKSDSGSAADTGGVVTTDEDTDRTKTQVSYANLADGLYEIQSLLAPNLDIEIRSGDTSNGGQIQTWASNSTASQRWKIARNSDGSYSFMNVKSGKYLDVPGANAKSQRALQEYDGNGTNAQRWFIIDHNGKYEIVSALDRSLAVDVTGANTSSGATIQLYKRNDTAAQRFSFKQILREIEDAVYTIANKGSNKSIDVSGASLNSEANVQQYYSNGTYAQEFQVAYDENTGYYTIRNVNSGRMLDVAGGSWSSGNGTNVWQYSPNGTDAQKWAVTKNADGSFTFKSALNGRALDLKWASEDSGANIWIYDPNGSDAQKWVLNKVVDWLKEGSYQIVSEVNHDNTMMAYESSVQSSAPVYMRVREDGNTAQGWYLTKATDGFVTFTNISSGLVLDLRGGNAANGSAVQQYDANGTDAQLWRVVIADNGYKLVSKLNSSFVIDIPSATEESFIKIQSYADNGTSAQRWHLVAFSPIATATNYEILAHANNTITALEGTQTTSYGTGIAGSSSSAAEFQFVDAGNNTYRIRLSNGTYLAAHSDNTVSTDAYNGQDSQTWRLEFNDEKGGFTLVSTLTDTALTVNGSTLALSSNPSTTFSFHKQQTKADQVINTAAEEIRKYGDNGSKYWDYYFGGGWVNWYTTPYCACFASWVLHENGVSCAGMPSASTTLIRNGARIAGRLISPRDAQRGDIVLYSWNGDGKLDHTGIVESNRGDGGITTIEGNTGRGDEEGIVMSQNRTWKYIAAIVRPYY